MVPIRPNLAWYTGLSSQRGVAPRCPFATVHRCPRYYQSLWLLGECSGATQIDPAEDEALRTKSEDSDMWPVTGEQATSVFGAGGLPKMFMNFCPETGYDRFGWFRPTCTTTPMRLMSMPHTPGWVARVRTARSGGGRGKQFIQYITPSAHYTRFCFIHSRHPPRRVTFGTSAPKESLTFDRRSGA